MFFRIADGLYTYHAQRVVEPDSANFPGYHTSCTIPADHIEMTRFTHAKDVGYERLSGKLREWANEVRGDQGRTQGNCPGGVQA